MSVVSARRSGVPLLVVAGVLWGTGGLLGAALAAVTGIAPAAVATYRLGGGGLLLCGYLLVSGVGWPRSAAAWRRILLVGVITAEFQAAYFAAVAASSVSVATLVAIGSAPVVVLIVDVVRGTRRIGVRDVTSVVLALVGLTLLVGVGAVGGFANVGTLYAVLAGTGFAVLTMVSARPVAGLGAPTTTGVGFVVGGALLVPIALLQPGGLGFTPGVAAFALLATLAVVPTALAYIAYFVGVASAPAGVGALVAVLEPLTAALLAMVFLGERLDAAGWAGAVLLAVAVALGASNTPERTR